MPFFRVNEKEPEVYPMRKRGVELSMNVIIIAAIALIVLVVLVLLVTNATIDVRSGTGCAKLNKGQCTDVPTGSNCAEQLGDGYVSIGKKDCPSTAATCCWVPFEPQNGGQ